MSYNSHLRKVPLPDISFFRERYSYNPETGDIYGRLRPDKPLRYLSGGYYKVNFSSDPKRARLIGSHVVAFALMEGRWPYIVDHINRVKTDNRWVNLREVASHAENMRNIVESCARIRQSGDVYRLSMVGEAAAPALFCDAYALKRVIDVHLQERAAVRDYVAQNAGADK